ncbi:hypothetical protein [Flavobacterium davisii]|uniref:hypothetical protein n=1 Tax=Flavobacterium davisii TaxID=2906077 RepID=UPI0035CFC46B
MKNLIDKSELLWLKEQFNNSDLDDDISWNSLTEMEKQIKRLLRSKIIRKSTNYTIDFFRYEECVIDLYEAVINCSHKLNLSPKKSIQITKLKAYLYLTKRNINSYKDVRKIKDFYFYRLKSLIYECLNCSLEKYFIEEINILYLESKLEILKRLQDI